METFVNCHIENEENAVASNIPFLLSYIAVWFDRDL